MIDADEDPIAHYYDGDYPSPEDTRFPENFDEAAVSMGVADDVPWYARLARAEGGPVLDLGCGTGRMTLPIAGAGAAVTAVDVHRGMLEALERKIAKLPEGARDRISVVEQDAAALNLPRRDHGLAILAFSTLLSIADFDRQMAALRAAAAHLRDGGLLALDIFNPLLLPLGGDPIPRPVCSRRHPETGRAYTRFATLGPVDVEQKQTLEGWYDEEKEGGGTTRRRYRIPWRLIHRFELELMLRAAGLTVESLAGGPYGEPYAVSSQRLHVTARKAAEPAPRRARCVDVSGVGITGRFTAAARAAETARTDRLFSDPLARRLAGAPGWQLLAELDGQRSAGVVVVRTRWIDDRLTAALAGGARVVTVLGAGLDTRWHRLSVPGDTLWVEVDDEAVLAFKAERLADVSPRCEVVRVPGNAGDPALGGLVDAAISGHGGDVTAPRVVVLEGLIPYLDAAQVDRLFESLAAMPRGTALLFDVSSASALDPSGPAASFTATLARHGAAWKYATDDPRALAARFGFAAEVTFVGARDAHYGRLLHPSLDEEAPLPVRTYLVHAVRVPAG